MALTRKMLEEMGVEESLIGLIIKSHVDTVDYYKEQLDKLSAQVEDTAELKKKLEKAQKAAEENVSDEFESKYKAVLSEYEQFKADVDKREATAIARNLYRAELEALGITGKRADKIAKASDLSSFEVVNGAYSDPEKVQEAIRADWADFIPTTKIDGADTGHPPVNAGGKPKPANLTEALRQRYEQKG